MAASNPGYQCAQSNAFFTLQLNLKYLILSFIPLHHPLNILKIKIKKNKKEKTPTQPPNQKSISW